MSDESSADISVELLPSFSDDSGLCVARVPQGLGYSTSDLVLVSSLEANYSAICIVLECETPPLRRSIPENNVLSSPSAHQEKSPSKVLSLCVRVDATVFVDKVPHPTEYDNYRKLTCRNHAAGDFSVSCWDKADAKLPSRLSKRQWKPAAKVTIEPACDSRTACISDSHTEYQSIENNNLNLELLKRAKRALTSLGRIPSLKVNLHESGLKPSVHADCGCLTLRERNGKSVLSRLRVYPAPPVYFDSETTFELQPSTASSFERHDQVDVAEPSECSTRQKLWARNGMLTEFRENIVRKSRTRIYNAVFDFLTQDLSSFASLGARPVTGLLLCGCPGVGKTFSAIRAAHDCRYNVLQVPKVANSYGAMSRGIRQVFEAGLRDPAKNIVFLDDLDGLCPKRDGISERTDVSRAETVYAVAQLLALMDDGSRSRRDIPLFVIGATSRPDVLDPALRRPGRFDREIVFNPPTEQERKTLVLEIEPSMNEHMATFVASVTPGYVAADLAKVCSVAFSKQDDSRSMSAHECCAECVGADSSNVCSEVAKVREAIARIRPVYLQKSVCLDVPFTRWGDIGGAELTKKRLMMTVEWPLKYPSTYNALGLKACRGILLCGPPGCCKTTLVRAAACASSSNFFHLTGADIFSCYLGEAERLLRDTFQSARAASPSIVFLDELEALVGKRAFGEHHNEGNDVKDRVLSTLLTEMDGLSGLHGVLVIGATNRIDLLDEALLRPGRFDEILHVQLPDTCERLSIMEIHARRLPLASDVELAAIVDKLDKASGADIAAICQEAGLLAMREHLTSTPAQLQVRHRHFLQAVALLATSIDHRASS